MAKTKTYAEKLKDPRWQKKRLEILDRAEFSCEVCGDGEVTLHVHHKAYFKGREPWEYDNDQLVALCEDCHEKFHTSQPDVLAEVVSRLPLDGPMSRRDIGLLLAAVIYPRMKFKDEFINRGIKKMREMKLDEQAFGFLWEVWGNLYREMAKDRDNNGDH